MPRYRVTLTRTSIEIVNAANPYQAAVIASQNDDGVEVESVTAAVGRPPTTSSRRATANNRPVKKVAKKRRPLSPEARAKLAQNLVKARAARAAKAKAAKRTTKKTSSAAKKKTRASKRR